jgi:hypothetical protein
MFRQERSLPKLRFVRRVTRRHGESFADGWLDVCYESGSIWEVFGETGLVTWPGGADGNPSQDRDRDIEDEILEPTFATVKHTIAQSFVKIGREVIDRERERQRKASDGK